MSLRMMSDVWERSQETGTRLLVLLAIAEQADDEGAKACATVGSLARKSRLSKQDVRQAIETLASSGELRVEPSAGPRGLPLYSFNFGAPGSLASREPEISGFVDRLRHGGTAALRTSSPKMVNGRNSAPSDPELPLAPSPDAAAAHSATSRFRHGVADARPSSSQPKKKRPPHAATDFHPRRSVATVPSRDQRVETADRPADAGEAATAASAPAQTPARAARNGARLPTGREHSRMSAHQQLREEIAALVGVPAEDLEIGCMLVE